MVEIAGLAWLKQCRDRDRVLLQSDSLKVIFVEKIIVNQAYYSILLECSIKKCTRRESQ